jgi:hypothetical protein
MTGHYIEDFNDDELIEELESRGYKVDSTSESVEDKLKELHEAICTSKPQDHIIKELIYQGIGRIL